MATALCSIRLGLGTCFVRERFVTGGEEDCQCLVPVTHRPEWPRQQRLNRKHTHFTYTHVVCNPFCLIWATQFAALGIVFEGGAIRDCTPPQPPKTPPPPKKTKGWKRAKAAMHTMVPLLAKPDTRVWDQPLGARPKGVELEGGAVARPSLSPLALKPRPPGTPRRGSVPHGKGAAKEVRSPITF